MSVTAASMSGLDAPPSAGGVAGVVGVLGSVGSVPLSAGGTSVPAATSPAPGPKTSSSASSNVSA
jgi:hypothetical protein